MKLNELMGFPTENKKPLFPWRNPHHRRSLEYLFGRYNQAGVVPAEHGCVVLDLDCKHGLDGRTALFAKFPKLPKSLNYKTVSGGWHLWYRVPEGIVIPQATSKIAGVDIRHADGYVCIGKDYEVIDDDIADCPDYLLAWLQEKPKRQHLGKLKTEDLESPQVKHRKNVQYNISPIPVGQRNDVMYRWGYGLLQGVNKKELSMEDFKNLMYMRGSNSGLAINEIDIILESLLR